MSLKNDLMYPFGNHIKDTLLNDKTIIALRNTIRLAEDRVRISNGEIGEILFAGGGGSMTDDVIARESIEVIKHLIKIVDGEEER
jgi:hypothetical protein